MSVAAQGPPGDEGDGPLVDPDALERFLDERLPGPARVTVERHRAGHSNETFFVTRGTDAWTLRRPPRGAFLPTAHDVLREYRVLSALSETNVRAPRPVLLPDVPNRRERQCTKNQECEADADCNGQPIGRHR